MDGWLPEFCRELDAVSCNVLLRMDRLKPRGRGWAFCRMFPCLWEIRKHLVFPGSLCYSNSHLRAEILKKYCKTLVLCHPNWWNSPPLKLKLYRFFFYCAGEKIQQIMYLELWLHKLTTNAREITAPKKEAGQFI